ncbi:F-box/WD repeat-containing protein 4 [Anoplophora glabripennis]|nr:F-box/WD repeat-containing protein 4 [Anoplophora glabripennis]
MESHSYFTHLSTELLIKIFHFLDISDLCKLKQTCKRFNEVILSWDYVLLKNIYPLVTNQQSNIFLSRCQQHLSVFEKIRISKNWKIGRYKEKDLLFVKRRYMPWLYLTDKSVWISRGRNIYCYERFRVNVSRTKVIFQGRSIADVGHFQIKNNFIVTGQRDGSMWLTSLQDRKVIFDEKECHESDINSVDISLSGDIIVSGSRDNRFKVWRVDYDTDTGALKKSHDQVFYDRVLRVSLSDDQPLLAVGTSGNNYRATLFVYDLERILDPVELSASRFGSGVLDLKWDTPHTIWSCGYDTCLRRWDLRTGKSEQNFYDPHASVVYCLEYDYYNTIMTGTQSYGRVILWDIRQPRSVQLYFMGCCKGNGTKNSPIYSLSFDSECLFTATDRNLNVLDFSVYNGVVEDYSFCCTY